MKTAKLFLTGCGLMLVAFTLYVIAPSARTRFQHPEPITPTAAQSPAVTPVSQPEIQVKPAVETRPAQKPRVVLRPALVAKAPAYEKPAPTVGYLDDRPEGHFSETFKVMAGAELQIQNPRYDHIEIRAAFPINVQIGNCSSTNTVDYQCDGAVADISALDLRAGADPSSAAANSVQVIARDSTVHPVRTYLVHRHSTFHISNSRCREIQVHGFRCVRFSL
jgi:hypothetical protein